MTDMTSWKSKNTDPRQIYRGNVDHWTKLRVTANARIARQLSKNSLSLRVRKNHKLLDETNKEDKRLWSNFKPKDGKGVLPCIRNEPFSKMIAQELEDPFPGALSEGASKYYGSVKNDYPGNNNKYHIEAAVNPPFDFWPKDKEKQLRKRAGDENRLPFTQYAI